MDIYEQKKKAQAAAAAAAVVAHHAHLFAVECMERAQEMVKELAKAKGAKAKSLLVREVPGFWLHRETRCGGRSWWLIECVDRRCGVGER